jgi:hypothetical protein
MGKAIAKRDPKSSNSSVGIQRQYEVLELFCPNILYGIEDADCLDRGWRTNWLRSTGRRADEKLLWKSDRGLVAN